MKLSTLFESRTPTLSFEVFPPKTTDGLESVLGAVEEIADLRPDFMSVTYGAGGGTGTFTHAIAADLVKKGVTPIAHLTCVASTREKVKEVLTGLQAADVDNILALRGDIPKDAPDRSTWAYGYASELVGEIVDFGGFCIGGACYPEGHVESANMREDLKRLKEKVDMGCSFLTTQMFFDNDILYRFLYQAREIGITVPINAGIMPVTNASQIKRITSLSGTYLPRRFVAIVDRFGDNPEAMAQAGIAYATEQIIDLYANGVPNVHVYSMNKPYVAKAISNNLSSIIKAAK